MKVCAILPVLVLLMSGCKLGSVNVQRSGLRGAGDLAVTVMLDMTAEANVPQLQERIITFLDTVEQFAATGEIALLTRTELTARLLAEVSEKYAPWVQGAISAALTYLDARAPIGEKNQRRILAYVKGSRRAVALYDIEDRAGTRAKVRALPANGIPPWPGG